MSGWWPWAKAETGKTYPDTRVPRWVTPEEVQLSKEVDATYGDPNSALALKDTQLWQFRDVPDTLAYLNNKQLRADTLAKMESLPEDERDQLYENWVAARRSPLAALGFDIRRMVSTAAQEGEKGLTVGGLYRPSGNYKYKPDPGERSEVKRDIELANSQREPADEMWVDIRKQAGGNKGAPIHESLHRGIELLRKEGRLPEISKREEEVLVRAAVLKHWGPIEMGDGKRGDEQVKEGEDFLKIPYNVKLLNMFESLAAQMIAEKQRGGPR